MQGQNKHIILSTCSETAIKNGSILANGRKAARKLYEGDGAATFVQRNWAILPLRTI